MRKQQQIKFLTPEQIQTLLESTGDKRDQAVLQTLVTTGLRVHEFANLPRDHFKPETHPEGQTCELPIIGKGNVQRVIFFSPACLKAIFAYQATRKDEDSDPRLFPFTIRTAQNIVSRCAREAGLGQVWPHMLRHSFATGLMKKGVSLFAIKEFLGHSSLVTTQQYLHVHNKDLREIHEKFYI